MSDQWKLVPIEPTQEMMDAGLYQSSHDSTSADVHSIWKDMVALAPTQGADATPADHANYPGLRKGPKVRELSAAQGADDTQVVIAGLNALLHDAQDEIARLTATQGADVRPVAWATKLPSGNLSSVRPSLKGAQKRTAAWNERFPNPPHAVTVALCECATRDAAPSDAQDAARYRWLSKRVVITDGSTPGLMVITVVDDGIETTNEFLDEFTEPALAAIESQRSGDGS